MPFLVVIFCVRKLLLKLLVITCGIALSRMQKPARVASLTYFLPEGII